MKHVDEALLESDIQQRYEFLCDFIGFTPDDVRLIQSSAAVLGPKIGEMVERTYTRLLAYDATARHFVPRQHGFDGEPPVNLSDLTVSHPQIRFRKDHLNRYFMSLIGRAFDAKMIQYLDMVGKIHTPGAGNAQIEVPLIQMNALMGLISDIVTDTLTQSAMNAETALTTLRAFQKLLWIQNDFISRHYASSTSTST
ncbi:MAG: protoglobin family protein [Planctomycetaceae bacterium]|nr:protoglobin family protein [Planctomycetaceae bacterium]